MEIYSLDAGGIPPRPRALALGFFDGLHLGHQAIIRAACAYEGLEHGVLTFREHPLQVLRPEAAPPLLTTLAEKQALLLELGLSSLILADFTPAFAALEPEAFVRDVLAGALQARQLVVGPNYRFGRGARGTPADLARLGRDLGLGVEVVPPVELDGLLVSSTRSREAVAAGQVAEAARLLGRPYRWSGEVVRGDQRGRALGFPTANLWPAPGKVLPPNGVYAVTMGWQGRSYPAVANLGLRPTFGGGTRVLEVHVLDFSADLYGAEVVVWFHERLRDECRFSGIDALKEQIARDVEAARSCLAATTSRQL